MMPYKDRQKVRRRKAMNNCEKRTTKSSKALVAATSRYLKANCKGFYLQYNLKTDADIIKKLQEVPNKQDYIRKLIRADIEK